MRTKPTTKKRTYTNLTVELDDAEYEDLIAEAKRRGISMTALLREALRHELGIAIAEPAN
jgi:post-segregation antitoxin (ccd killing protein)